MGPAPTSLAAGPHSVASASVAASRRTEDSQTKFHDAVVHWAVLERLGARPEITTVPDEATARRLYDEYTTLAREQAPTEPHRRHSYCRAESPGPKSSKHTKIHHMAAMPWNDCESVRG